MTRVFLQERRSIHMVSLSSPECCLYLFFELGCEDMVLCQHFWKENELAGRKRCGRRFGRNYL
jgi:hypothetical protein